VAQNITIIIPLPTFFSGSSTVAPALANDSKPVKK
jgi:hypothetical protein